MQRKSPARLSEADDISLLKGIGQKYKEALLKMGIITVGDLLSFTPKGYKDRGLFSTVSKTRPGRPALIKATLKRVPKMSPYARKRVALSFEDEEGTALRCVFFNQPYRTSMTEGKQYAVYGILRDDRGTMTFFNPQTEPAAENEYLTEGIYAVWGLPFGSPVTQKRFSGYMRQAIDLVQAEEDTPFHILDELDIPSRDTALALIHFPHSAFDVERGGRYELVRQFLAHIGFLEHSAGVKREKTAPMKDTGAERFLSLLPFELTSAQYSALSAIQDDLRSGTLMRRLLQGDVGSGKTAVAATAAFITAANGFQAVICAPTEILARQHYGNYRDMLLSAGIGSAVLYSGQPKKDRRANEEKTSSGEAGVIFGTHALFAGQVSYHSLKLAVIDEQQRYGVGQRAALQAKGEQVHILSMSATPIPRTLQLSAYKNLDVSVIDSLPSGRKAVGTYAVGGDMDARLYAFAKKIVSEGGGVYIVCPAIDEEDMENVNEMLQEAKKALAPIGVAALTGAMKQDRKNEVMQDFVSAKTPVLVSTSIVEVGVDVKTARLMWIKGADRFGLSQLHQLRGRVGRGEEESYCILQTALPPSELVKARLEVLCESNDGFTIAAKDLALRGGGEIYGMRQSGHDGGIAARIFSNPALYQECEDLYKRLTASGSEEDRRWLSSLEETYSPEEEVVLN